MRVLSQIFQAKARFAIGLILGVCVSVLVCWALGSHFELGESPTISEAQGGSASPEVNRSEVAKSAVNFTLQEVAQISSPAERKKQLSFLLDALTANQIDALITESTELLEGRKLQSALNSMFAKLTRADPNRALERVWRLDSSLWTDLVATVFGEWSTIEMDSAFNAASELKGLLRETAMMSIVSNRAGSSEGELLALAKDYGIEPMTQQVLSEARARLLMDQPSEAFQTVLSDSVEDNEQLDLLLEIADVWVRLEGANAFVPILQAMDAIYDEWRGLGSLRLVVQRAAEFDPKAAWDRLLSLSSDAQMRYYDSVLVAWVKVDPMEALDANFQFAHRNPMVHQGAVLRSWARIAPYDVLDHVASFPQEDQADAIGFAIGQLARYVSVEVAREHLDAMKANGHDIKRGVDALIRVWMFIDTESAAEWLVRNSDASSYSLSYQLRDVIERMTLEDPSKAMEFALSQPIDESEDGSGLEDSVIAALAANGRFDEALVLLHKVREPRLADAVWSVGRNFIQFDRPSEAVRMALRLPEDARENYFEGIVAGWFNSNPVQLVEWLERIPGKKEQAAVARSILRQQQFGGDLTKEQIDKVEAHLKSIEEDA